MNSAIEIVATSLKTVLNRQQLLMANLTGNAFLVFVVYSWRVLNYSVLDDPLNSVPLLVGVFFLATWLNAATLAAFHPGVTTTPFIPVFRRMPQVLLYAGAVGATVALFAWMGSVLGPFVWIVGGAAILALLPLVSHAAGGGFSKGQALDVLFSARYWMAAVGLLVAGLALPFVVFSWIAIPDNAFFRLVFGSLRLGLASLLLILSWVTLAAVIGQLGAAAPASAASSTAERSSLGRVWGKQPDRPEAS